MSPISFLCAPCVRVANLRGYGLLKVQTIVKQFNCGWIPLDPPLFIVFKIKTTLLSLIKAHALLLIFGHFAGLRRPY